MKGQMGRRWGIHGSEINDYLPRSLVTPPYPVFIGFRQAKNRLEDLGTLGYAISRRFPTGFKLTGNEKRIGENL